jgi:hypothetical protein
LVKSIDSNNDELRDEVLKIEDEMFKENEELRNKGAPMVPGEKIH